MKKITRRHTAFQTWLNTGICGQFIEVRIPLCPPSICDEKDHMPKKSDISDFFAYMDTKISFAKPWIT